MEDDLKDVLEILGPRKVWELDGVCKFYKLEADRLIMLRNLLEGVIYCIEQGLWVRELTTEMIVFLDDDPTFLRPKIIDCMLSAAPVGKAWGKTAELMGLHDIIKDQLTFGRPDIVHENPDFNSFMTCLRNNCAAPLAGKDASGNCRECGLLMHPLFLNDEQYATYVETVYNQMHGKGRFQRYSLKSHRIL
ncbi:uncharacterized protein LOC113314066 [Papaver somniferum]|uniref:uncharacterized protein LOC113314066 n=1 Tax=Papaver somniferum TaxID=3469 RepID=UPI000E6F8485|nr:uncharacterized protein LOC113314066 [Papaver somniferum]